MDIEVKKDHPVCSSEPDLSKLNSELTNQKTLELIGKSLDKLDKNYTELENAANLSLISSDGTVPEELLAADSDYVNNLINKGQDRVRDLNENVKSKIEDPATEKDSKMSPEVKKMCKAADMLEIEFKQVRENINKVYNYSKD